MHTERTSEGSPRTRVVARGLAKIGTARQRSLDGLLRASVATMRSSYESLEFFTLLGPEQRRAFERLAHLITVGRNDAVVNQDALSTDVFFVIDGQFEVTICSETGKSVFYRAIGSGDLFGELAAVDDGPRSATVSAQCDSRLVRLTGTQFRKLIESSPKAAMWLVRKHTALIRAMTERLFEQIAYDVNTRIRAELLRLAQAAGIVDNQARIFPVATHNKLAIALGTTREAVTRELRELAKKGLVKQQGRELLILDVDGLMRLHKQQTTIP